MALVVETTSTVTNSNADNLTITKPAGVSVGDLLILIATGDDVAIACSGFSELLSASNSGNETAAVKMLYRIADSSDVSASDYTVTLTGSTSLGAAAMMRVSGWTSGNPLFSSHTTGDQVDASSYTISSGTVSLSRLSQQLLIMAGNQSSADNHADFSGYTITSSDSNPTWTELMDVDFTTESGVKRRSFFVAYALSSNTSTITAYSVSVSSSTSGVADTSAVALAVICSPQNATVSNDVFQTTPVTFATLTGSTQEPNNDFHEVIPEFFSQSGQGTSLTQWTANSKPSTTWTPNNK